MLKVSIITICYNSQKTIIETIESVKNQTYENIEYIIVDGGSTDGTLEILKEYHNCIDKIEIGRDGGISDAFNKGILFASGELILFLNSDDWLADNNVISEAISFYKDEDTIICGSINLIKNGKKYLNTFNSIPKRLKSGMYIRHPASFTPKKVFNNIGNFDTNYKIAMDYEFMMRALIRDYKFISIPIIVSHMRYGGASSNYFGAAFEELRIKKKYFPLRLKNYFEFIIFITVNGIFSHFRK